MRRASTAIGIALLLAMLNASAAEADHHFVKIREYHPGNLAVPDDGFLELQMYAPGQNLIGGQEIHMYDSTGAPPEPAVYVPSPFLPPPPNAENQRTILIGGANGPADRDYTENLDTQYDPAGGALCFVSTEGFGQIDCLEWGTGTGMVDAGTPAAPSGIPDAQSLNRSIAPGCATLLEAGDDSDDSAADFALGAPSPRSNAVVPTETACAPGGGGGDTNPPETTITKSPKKKLRKARAKVKFDSSEPGSAFQCRLDESGFKPCDSPFRKRVDRGRHKFAVFATDAAGNADASPAKAKFRRVARR